MLEASHRSCGPRAPGVKFRGSMNHELTALVLRMPGRQGWKGAVVVIEGIIHFNGIFIAVYFLKLRLAVCKQYVLGYYPRIECPQRCEALTAGSLNSYLRDFWLSCALWPDLILCVSRFVHGRWPLQLFIYDCRPTVRGYNALSYKFSFSCQYNKMNLELILQFFISFIMKQSPTDESYTSNLWWKHFS